MKRYHVFVIRIWSNHEGKIQKKLCDDYGKLGLEAMYGAMYVHPKDGHPVVFDRGGEVAMQVLPSGKYPEAPYKAAGAAEEIGFGFDYIDLLGNYRSSDGSLVFSGPSDPQVAERSDGTIAFSGPRNPDS
jgi:hypothetical protein